MSGHEMIDEGAVEDLGGRSGDDKSRGEGPGTATCQEHAPDSPPVLARMPNLESTPPKRDEKTALRRGREGRLLGSKWAMWLLVGAAVGLVLLAVLPLVLSKKGTGSPSSNDHSWRSEVPAPSATLAAPWTAPSGESPGSGPSRPATAPTTAWGDNALAIGGPQQPDISSWRDAGQWPYGGTEPQQAAPAAELTQSAPAAADTPASYDSRYQASRPAPGYYDPYRPAQADTNRPLTLGEPGLTDTARYGDRYRQTEPSAFGVGAGTGTPVRSPPVDPRITPSAAGPRYDRYATEPPYGGRTDYRQAADPSRYGADGRYDARAVSPPYGYHNQTDYRDRGQEAYPATTSFEPYSTSGYGAAGAAQSGERGVARLQGVIERPPVNTANHSNRSSLY